MAAIRIFALAHRARLVTHIVQDRGAESSRVLSFGGSYPGNLAAWFRLKYPHVTDGSVASSAPLRAETNFSQYMEVVTGTFVISARPVRACALRACACARASGKALQRDVEALNQGLCRNRSPATSCVYVCVCGLAAMTDALTFWEGSQACNNAVKAAVGTLVAYADQGPESPGYAQLSEDFSTCEPLQSELDVATLFSDLMGNIQGTVQYNRESSRALNVTDICVVLTNSSHQPYDNFVTLSNKFTAEFFSNDHYDDGRWYDAPCEDASWDNTVALIGNATRASSNNMRPWTYQTCNEFGRVHA